MADLSTIFNNAADWIEANPSKHTRTTLARNSSGDPCDPLDADAQCFCALGVIAMQNGLVPSNEDESDYQYIRQFLGLDKDQTDEIYYSNDSLDDMNGDTPFVCGRRRGSPSVVDFLRKLAS